MNSVPNKSTSIVHYFFGKETLDESHRVLCDFLYRWLNRSDIEKDKLEFEGKIGILLSEDNEDKRYHHANCFSENIVRNVENSENVIFQSSVSPQAFQKLNKNLNERCVWFQELQEGYKGVRMTYNRKTEVDLTLEVSKTNKVRVTVDPEDDTKWIRAIKKEKGENLNLSCPHSQWDYRFTASYEKDVPMPPKNTPIKKMRRKDRISYSLGIWQVDISFVEMFPCDSFGKPIQAQKVRTFEVEMEVNTKALLIEKEKLDRKEPNAFQEFGLGFLQFMRTIQEICNIVPGDMEKLAEHRKEAEQHQTQQNNNNNNNNNNNIKDNNPLHMKKVMTKMIQQQQQLQQSIKTDPSESQNRKRKHEGDGFEDSGPDRKKRKIE